MASDIVGDGPCPQCREAGGDRTGNHLIHFSNGNKYCPKCEYKELSGEPDEEESMYKTIDIDSLEAGDYRGITAYFMGLYGYKVLYNTSNREVEAVYYPIHVNGQHTGWKIRNVEDKSFSVTGTGKGADLTGMQVSGGKRLCIIVEGENDAAAAKQMMADGTNWYDNRARDWTVVSVPFGSNSKINKYSHEWLTGFDSIIIATDMDEAGEELAHTINTMFKQGVCKRAVLPLKDAHECLTNDLAPDFVNAIQNPRAMVASGIIMGDDYFSEVLAAYRANADGGTPYPPAFSTLNELIYGQRYGEVDLYTSGSGMGKTQFLREVMHFTANDHDERIGVLALEEPVSDTLIGQMSITDNRPLHLPEVKQGVSDEELEKIYNDTSMQNYVLFNHFGSLREDSLIDKLRYMIVAMGCRKIILDHISIVVSEYAADTDERKAIDQLMTRLKMLTQEHDVWIGIVSHLRKTSSGPSFEEGAIPSLDDLRGSGSLKQLSNGVIALSRNQQDPDILRRNTTQITVLKNRFCGRTGPAGRVWYDPDTGRMVESLMTDEEYHSKSSALEMKL